MAVNPPDACSKLNPPPSYISTKYFGEWIAVVRRYNCSFTEKVLNAQRAGYKAVIVHNVGSNDLCKDVCLYNYMSYNKNQPLLRLICLHMYLSSTLLPELYWYWLSNTMKFCWLLCLFLCAVRMGSNRSAAREVTIPSVFIGADDGYMIVEHFTYGKGWVETLENFNQCYIVSDRNLFIFSGILLILWKLNII